MEDNMASIPVRSPITDNLPELDTDASATGMILVLGALGAFWFAVGAIVGGVFVWLSLS